MKANDLRDVLYRYGKLLQSCMLIPGSNENSVQLANRAGVDVVELDASVPFTAARARNEGFKRVRRLDSALAYIQFVDGDCEVVKGWLEKAVAFLEVRSDVAVVYGRRRERHPLRSIYNLLCDIEWDTPIGEVRGCGGDALIRVAALERVGGYRPDVVAAEDTELCARIRAAGWKVWRLEAEMTVHDAAMTRFAQWWRRAVRAGYAFAHVSRLHGASPERLFVWESRRAWLWGIWLPLFASWIHAVTTLGMAHLACLSIANASAIFTERWAISTTRLALCVPGLGTLSRRIGSDKVPEGSDIQSSGCAH